MRSTDILRIENLKFDKKTYTLRWKMTLLCNYYCDFCIQGDKEFHITQAKKESPQIREKICGKLVALIEDLNGKAESIRLYLLGGEVTLLKDFLPILSRLIEAKFDGMIKIFITTNVSMDKKTCRRLVSLLSGKKNRRLVLTCSYYKEHTDERSYFQKVDILTGKDIYGKIVKRIFHKKGLICTISYPLKSDEDYEQYLQFMQRHENYAGRFRYVIIRNYKTSISNSVKEKLRNIETMKNIKVTLKDGRTEYFTENQHIGLILDEELYFQPKGLLCDVGMKNLNIDPQGNMSYCASAAEETMFGNICSDTPVFLNGKMRCQARWCGCGYYSIVDNDSE